MAWEKSCNLDKEEAEILKPSSSSSSSPTPPPASPAASSPSLFHKPSQELPIQMPERSEAPASDPGAAVATSGDPARRSSDKERETETPGRFSHRCSTCRRRVGLTGFRCRCGDLFCARHRYSDTHDCSVDYKAAGREAIAKANPLIRAAKIIKI